MNEVTTFASSEFGEVRAIVINCAPWFVGTDVAKAIGYDNAHNALRLHVDDEDKILRPIKGVRRDMVVVNEAGVYSLVFASKLQRARDFSHWLTTEILPTFRRPNTAETKALDDCKEEYRITAKDRISLAKLIATVPIERMSAVKKIIQPLIDDDLDELLPANQAEKEMELDEDEIVEEAYRLGKLYGMEYDGEYIIEPELFNRRFVNIGWLRVLKILLQRGILKCEEGQGTYTARRHVKGKRKRYIVLRTESTYDESGK